MKWFRKSAPPPRAPFRSERRAAFLHIPKTAGTSLNTYLQSHYEPGEVALHIEYEAEGRPWRPEDFTGRKLVCGHLKYDELDALAGLRDRFSITVLRDPESLLLSSLAWLIKCGSEEKRDERHLVHPAFHRMIERWREQGTENILTTITNEERAVFDNVCTRMLASLGRDDAVDERALETALNRLDSFDAVGLTEQLDSFLLLLAARLEWPPPDGTPRVNQARPDHYRALGDITGGVKSRIAELTRYDRILYDRARELFSRQWEDMLGMLSREYPGAADALSARPADPAAVRSVLMKRSTRHG